jgi:hypothetical protein
MFKSITNKIREFLNLTYFTSKLDQFLNAFDQAHPRLSASQREEKEKYDRIFKLRDDANAKEDKKNFWSNF